jgi:hypothetical protein
VAGRRHGGFGPAHHLRALEVVGELDERAGRQDLDVGARPGGFGAAGGGADQPVPPAVRRDRGRQDPGDGGDRAVEGELAEHREAREGVARDRPDRRHDADRDRQVVMAPLLGQVGGGEIDGDALHRDREARGDQGGAHPLARFGHRLVGQADEHSGRAY